MEKAAKSTWQRCLCHAVAGWLLLHQKRENLGCSSSLSSSLTSSHFSLSGVGIPACILIPVHLLPSLCFCPACGSLSSCGKAWFVVLGLRHHLPLLLHVCWQEVFRACVVLMSFSAPLHPYVQKGVNLYPSFLKEKTILRTFLLQNLLLRN